MSLTYARDFEFPHCATATVLLVSDTDSFSISFGDFSFSVEDLSGIGRGLVASSKSAEPYNAEHLRDVIIPKARSDILQKMKTGQLKPDKSHFNIAIWVWEQCASDKNGSFLSKSDFEACLENRLFSGDPMLEQIVRGCVSEK